MKVFIWHRVKQCSARHHSKGGVVVFAETEENARKLAVYSSQDWDSNDPDAVVFYPAIQPDEMPDYVCDAPGATERVFIMPDAGCC